MLLSAARTARALMLAASCAVCASALAQRNNGEITDFEPATPPRAPAAQPRPGPVPCAFNQLPDNFDLFATGAYGGRPMSVQVDQSGHEATRFDVAVHSPGQPVVLMLGAYEPSVWYVGWTEGTRIAAVWVSGYHRQVVLGLPRQVPVLNSSYEERQKNVCPYYYFSGTGELAQANRLARSVFGRPIKMFYPKPQDDSPIYIGGPIPAGARIVTSNATKLEDVVDKNAPMAGPAGLKDAVSKGFIRKATAADYEAYLELQARTAPKPDLPPIAGDDGTRKPVRHFEGYVVLKPWTFPAGLYGGNSTAFILPPGVPMPSGNPGHSVVYDMNSGRCRGAICQERP